MEAEDSKSAVCPVADLKGLPLQYAVAKALLYPVIFYESHSVERRAGWYVSPPSNPEARVPLVHFNFEKSPGLILELITEYQVELRYSAAAGVNRKWRARVGLNELTACSARTPQRAVLLAIVRFKVGETIRIPSTVSHYGKPNQPEKENGGQAD
jgi:hypothetical protein